MRRLLTFLQIHPKELFAAILFFVLTAAYFWPILKNPATTIVEDYDGLFTAFAQVRLLKNLETGTYPFDAAIYHPEENTLAYSDPYLTHAALSAPVWFLTGEPLAVANYSLILAQLITLLFTYFLLHELTNDRLVALSGSILFAFSVLRLHYLGHLHTMALEFIPLSFLSLVKISKLPRKRWFFTFFAAFFLQTANNFLTGYFILFAAAIAFLFHKQLRQNFWKLRSLLFPAAALTGALLMPIIYPYLWVSRHFDYTRPLTDVIHFSLSPEEVITKFFSAALFSFILIGAYLFFRYLKLTPKKTQRASELFNRLPQWYIPKDERRLWKWQVVFFLTGLGSLIMSLGPALHWLGQTIKVPYHIPLPYLLFYYLAPGFGGFRTPSRWLILAAFSLMVFAALSISRLPDRLKNGLVSLLLLLGLISIPALPVVPVPSSEAYPPVYGFIESRQETVIAELPMHPWGNTEANKNEVYRMLYSLKHNKRLLNGYSGFTPPDWLEMVNRLNSDFPSPEAFELLRSRGANLVLLHLDEYQNGSEPQFRSALNQAIREANAALITEINQTVIVKL